MTEHSFPLEMHDEYFRAKEWLRQWFLKGKGGNFEGVIHRGSGGNDYYGPDNHHLLLVILCFHCTIGESLSVHWFTELPGSRFLENLPRLRGWTLWSQKFVKHCSPQWKLLKPNYWLLTKEKVGLVLNILSSESHTWKIPLFVLKHNLLIWSTYFELLILYKL